MIFHCTAVLRSPGKSKALFEVHGKRIELNMKCNEIITKSLNRDGKLFIASPIVNVSTL